MPRPQWITEDRVEAIDQSFEIVSAPRQKSHRDYRPPRTLESDFTRLLEHEVPHTNFDFELIHDWFAAQAEDYHPVYIRGQQTPIDWKSKIGNSDMSLNFKTDYREKIQKGDYVIREDGMVYLLNWNVTTHPNNQASQTVECNDYLTFTREHRDAVDKNGFVIDDESNIERDEHGRDIIVKEVPVSHSEYAGRPEYSISQNQPGVTANNLINIYVQWNDQTRKIQIDDTVIIHNVTYTIQNVYTAEVSIDKTHGCLYMQARRSPGGVIVDKI